MRGQLSYGRTMRLGPRSLLTSGMARAVVRRALLHWRTGAAGGQGGGMRSRRGLPLPAFSSSAFAGFRFPPDIIVLALRWYLRFGLSYRDVEELLAERGIEVDHVTVYRWMQRFTPLLAEAAEPCRHVVGDCWFVDETYVKVAGKCRYVYGPSTSTARSSTATSQPDATRARRAGSSQRCSTRMVSRWRS